MGGCFSVSIPCDQVVNQVSQWLCLNGSYIHNLPENLASLQKAMGVLKAKRDDVQGRVDREEFTGRRRRLTQVQVWLTSILTIENQYTDLLSTSKLELQRLCLCGFCSKYLKSSYRYGKRVVLMLREVESVTSLGDFDVLTAAVPITEVEEMPIQPTIVGQERMLERVWNRLMDENFGILGLYGMGGVGKTTLLTQINNKFCETGGGFNVVIWVVVSKNSEIRKIQGDIAEKLGLGGELWDQKDENQRSLDIHKVLRRQKFVLLLDDLWQKVNLKALGVPYPSKENGCKVAFTTRSRDVCRRMGVVDPMKVSCLDPDEAWDLFQRKVGESTLGSHREISILARKVVEKCRGLPLALNVIGETMACKSTIQEWHHAIDVLTSSATKFSGMEDEILPILKYSYDNLNGEQVKSCFLYCSLFPEDYHIDKEMLVDCWISEGFIDEKEGREGAVNEGYEIFGNLVRACLLIEEAEHAHYVKMHDVVREMALWIESDFGKHKERCIVHAGAGLREVPTAKDWRVVRRMSLMKNEIEEIKGSPSCPELTTLFLQINLKLVHISGDFFQFMPRLLILNLHQNNNLDRLPEQISELVSLKYLDLSSTNINRLPAGIRELKTLTYLNLEYMSRLESIDGISELSSLRKLGLLGSEISVKEVQLLKHLESLTLEVTSSSVLEQLLGSHKMAACVRKLAIRKLLQESFQILLLPTMESLYKLTIWNCAMGEIVIQRTSWNKNPTSPCFPNLSSVWISKCDGLKNLTLLSFAPNLTSLELLSSKQLEDIISQEEAAMITDGQAGIIIPFQKLTRLELSNLPELKSIYWSPLSFPCLREIYVTKCPKLRKLPLDSRSCVGDEFVLKYLEEEWLEEVEWEDDATRFHFSLACMFV